MSCIKVVLCLQIPRATPRDPRPDAMRPSMLIPALMLVLACVAAQGCLLFTGSVNTPPTVQIVVPTAPFNRSAGVKLSAVTSDADGGPIRLEWSTSPGDCMPPFDLQHRPATTFQSPTGDPTFVLPFMPGDSTLCVWVLATDPQGATAVAATPVSSQDQAPTAAITVLEPTTTASNGLYELYSTFHLSAATSTDPDGDAISDPTWQLLEMPPTTRTDLALVPCPSATQPTAFLQCLDVGGVAGVYTIGLTVSDGLKTSDVAMKTLTVNDDHPACVSKTDPSTDASPIVLDPGEAKTLAITGILDDGSPLPTPVEGMHTAPTFKWQVRRNGGAWTAIAGYDDVNAFTLPENVYTPGDVVDVDVTISDGVAMHLQPACDPRCPAGCPQSARWTMEYR